ncbi:MAG TPA: hypothetical protein VLQ46_09755 [Casimicrobiaceae bacterium]|nr:hypothetical protein [Casimicrobiaceae bacterium]
MSELRNNTDRLLLTCSLWLHGGFVGAVAVAAGLIQLFDGEASAFSALVLALSGGVLAAACWHRARTVLLEDPKPSITVAARNLEKKYAQSD